MADPVEPIVGKIIYKEEDRPTPPCVGGEFVRCERVCGRIDHSDKDAEHRSEGNADEADQDIVPRVFSKISVRIAAAGVPGLDRDQRRENWYGDQYRTEGHLLYFSPAFREIGRRDMLQASDS